MSESPWILLRGLTRDSRHWGVFAEQLQQRYGEAQVLMLDLPGNGERNGERSPETVEAMADWCQQQLQVRGLRPPYRLLAMSLGAMVAVAWMQRHPGQWQRCVLINTSLRPYSAFYQRLRPGCYGRVLGIVLRWQQVRYCEQQILAMTSAAPDRQGEALGDWRHWRAARPVSRVNAWRQLRAAMRYRAPAQAPEVPTLLLAGAADRLVNPQCSRQLARAWQLPLHEHTWAGHDLPLDDPAWVLAQL